MADPSIPEIQADIKEMDKLAEEVYAEIVKKEAELHTLDEQLDTLDASIVGASKLIETILKNKTGGGRVEMSGRKRHLQAIEELELKIGGGGLTDPEHIESAMDELEGMHTLLKLHDMDAVRGEHGKHGKQHGEYGKQHGGRNVGHSIAAQVALAATLVAFSVLQA